MILGIAVKFLGITPKKVLTMETQTLNKEDMIVENNKKKQFLSGMKAGIPVIFGFIPVGIAYAIMARDAGLSIFQTCGMSLSVFAGASQIMATGMIKQGASLIAIILTTFLLNLRHIIMSICVMDKMKPKSTCLKLLAGFGVTDESFAIFTTEKQEKCTPIFFLGLILVTYSSWNIGTLIGAIASNFLPDILSASLGIALYALFIGLLVPGLTNNRKLTALVIFTAVCNSILSQLMDFSWSLIISTLVCAFIGVFFVDLKEDDANGQH